MNVGTRHSVDIDRDIGNLTMTYVIFKMMSFLDICQWTCSPITILIFHFLPKLPVAMAADLEIFLQTLNCLGFNIL